MTVRRGGKLTDLPMHGNKKDLPTGLINGIKRNLGLKRTKATLPTDVGKFSR